MLKYYAPPSLLVTPDDKIVHISEGVGRYLVHPGGELTANVVKLVREELRMEVRSILHSVRENSKPMCGRSLIVRFDGKQARVRVDAPPATEANHDGFVLVIFNEQTNELIEFNGTSPDPSSALCRPIPPGAESLVTELQAEFVMTRTR